MSHFESDDDLDRALFALELEEPPAGLRANILAKTIYRAPISVRPWELWAIGSLAAVIVWLIALIVQGGSVPAFDRAWASLGSGLALFSQPDVLFWIALGASTAFWISQMNLIALPGASRSARR